MVSSSSVSLSFVRKLVISAGLLAAPAASFGSVFISVNFAPPPLPVYAQPYCPGEGYLWTPGYWAYDDNYEGGYFWVPGTWVQPPTFGYLWTPGYWGYGESAYLFHPGYWGPHIGFYGGVNYGFGYIGHGYEGGYWEGNRFNYNRAVNNINSNNVQNTYVKNVTVVNNYNNVSYNGGQGGVQARALPQEVRAQHEQHLQPTAPQLQHQQLAATNKAQFASVNGGRPAVAAAPTPADFKQNVQRGVLGSQVNKGQANRMQPNGGSLPPSKPAVGATNGVAPNGRISNVNPVQTQSRVAAPTAQANRPAYQAPVQQSRPQAQPQPRTQYQPPPQRPEYQQQRQPQMQQGQPRPQMQESRPAPAPRQEMAPRQDQQHGGGGEGRPRL